MRVTNSRHIRLYAPPLVLFLAYLAICMGVFIIHERRAVEEQTIRALRANVEQQCEHFITVINTQFAVLEGMADFVSEQEVVEGEASLALAGAITANSGFSRITIITPDGISHAADGATADVHQRAYYTRAMSGERAVSNPVPNQSNDLTEVVLAVPVRGQEGKILGVVSGAYNIGYLNEFLFSDLYGGSGHSFLVTPAGELISASAAVIDVVVEDFFEFYAELDFLNSGSMEQMRSDFANAQSGYFFARHGSEVRYLVYQPSGLHNGWMMCYAVSQQEASADYGFILRDVFCLALAFLAGLAFLFLSTLHITIRDRLALLRQAHVDPLTGLLNRASTRALIDEWFSVPGRKGILLMLDLDNFKSINDIWGHQAGDAILQMAADLLQEHFRQSDVVGRIGGDEFMVLMKDVSDLTLVEDHLCRLCSAFHRLSHPDYPQISLSCSVGAAAAPAQGSTFDELYHNADHALYQAKSRGKGGWSIHGDPHEGDIPSQ